MRRSFTLSAIPVSRWRATDRHVAPLAEAGNPLPAHPPVDRVGKGIASTRALKRFVAALPTFEDFSSTLCPFL